MADFFPDDTFHHTQKLKAQMRELIDHLRADANKVAEPAAHAIFETSAAVISGLVKALDDYENKHTPPGQFGVPAKRSMIVGKIPEVVVSPAE